jgi:hypothetical protein
MLLNEISPAAVIAAQEQVLQEALLVEAAELVMSEPQDAEDVIAQLLS